MPTIPAVRDDAVTSRWSRRTPIAIAIAMVALPSILPTFSYSDPKLIVEFAIWGLYAATLLARYALRLDGRKVMILSLIGFFGSVLSLTVINALLSGFHKFN